MSTKRDLKAQKIQVEKLQNKDANFIESSVAIRMKSFAVDISNNLDLVTKFYVDGVGSSIPLYDPGLIYSTGKYAIYKIGDVTYIFRSNTDNNTDIPSLTSTKWDLIGTPSLSLLAGPNTPISSQGKNGDIYFFVPNDSSAFGAWQKTGGAWVSIFTVPLVTSGVITLTFNESNLISDGFGGYKLTYNTPTGLSLASATTKSGTLTTVIDPSLSTIDTASSPNSTLTGFPNNATQTITLKLV